MVFAVALVAVIPATRARLLRALGTALVAPAIPLPHADIIVLSVDSDGAGALEAADLIREGFASHVALFVEPQGPVAREFARRGLPFFDQANKTLAQLQTLRIAQAERITQTVQGTGDEGIELPAWCELHGYRTVIFVTTSDHSRRSRRLMARATRGKSVRVVVQPSPYSEFQPEDWWTHRTSLRIGLTELQKLLLDTVLHPFS